MRPQGFGQGAAGLEDLGWNDMGFEPPKPVVAPIRDEDHDAFGEELPDQPVRNPLAALTPVPSPVHDQQAEIADRLAPPEDVSEEGEEFDETAELFEPDDELPEQPVVDERPEPTSVEAAPEVAIEPTPFAVAIKPSKIAVARRAPTTRAAPGSKAKAAFTLRLDPARHLKLRLACAVSARSAQQLVTDAVDQLLASMPELDAMAAKAKRKE